MKKFLKVCLILVACFMFLGLFFAGIGFAFAGTNIKTEFARGMNRSLFNLDYVKIGSHVDADSDSYEINFSDWTNSLITIYDGKLEETEIASRDEINKVICKIAACDFNVVESENDTFRIESTTTGKFRCYQSENTLYFEGINEKKIGTNITGSITLYIPKDLDLEEFEVHAGACDLDIDKIMADQVDIEIGAGDVYIREIIATDITCNLGAGNVEIDYIDTDRYVGQIGAGEITIYEIDADSVETNVGVGNAEFSKMKANTISLVCAMGSIDAVIDGNEEDYSYSAKCVAGNVSIGNGGGVILGTSSNSGLSKDKKITADCAMGSIEIRFK